MAGQKTITQRIAFEGGRDMEIQLKNLGEAGAAAFVRIKQAADNSTGFGARLTAVIEAVRARLNNLADAATNLRNKFNDFGSALRTTATRLTVFAAAVAGAVAGFFALEKGAADAADEALKTAEALGLTVKEFQNLQFAAGASNLSNDKLEKGLLKLAATANISEKRALQLSLQQKQLSKEFSSGKIQLDDYLKRQEALTESTTQVIDPFQRLGISVRKNNGDLKNSRELLLDLADAFQRSDDAALKLQLTTEIFGTRAGKPFIDLLNQGAAGIAKLEKEGQRLAPAFTAVENEVGQRFGDTLDSLTRSIDSAKNSFLLLFAPEITNFMKVLTEVIAENRNAFLALGRTILTQVQPVLRDLGRLLAGEEIDPNGFVGRARDGVVAFARDAKQAIVIVVGAWEGFVAILDTIAGLINRVFGTNLTGQALAIVAVIGVLTGAFSALAALISTIVAAIGVFDAILVLAFGPGGALMVGLALLGTAIGALIAQIPAVQDAFNAVVEGFNGTVANFIRLFDLIGDGWDSLWEAAAATVRNALGGVYDFISVIIDKINVAINAVKTFFSISSGGQSSSPGFKSGGKVNGPGSSRSDSILARLSNGEFVQQAPAVTYYGERFMHALNNMQIPRSVLDGIAGFANGGLVRAASTLMPVPGFASGGLVSSEALMPIGNKGRPFVLQIGDETFTGLSAEDRTAEKLSRFATRRNIQSAGRKPHWT